MKKRILSCAAFTIVELIVVIAIIGVLSAFLIPTFIGYAENARTSACETNQKTILRCLLYDSTLESNRVKIIELAQNPLGDFEPYFDAEQLKCPEGGEYEIIPIYDANGIMTGNFFIFCTCYKHHADYDDAKKAAVDYSFAEKGLAPYDWDSDPEN